MKRRGFTLVELCILIVILAIGFALMRCCLYDRSEVMYEPAEVIDVLFTPPTHGEGVSMGKQTRWTTYDTEPVYGVVFKCQHGQFAVSGSDDHHKRIWERCPKGTKVQVEYCELTSNGVLKGYDFLDAQPEAR